MSMPDVVVRRPLNSHESVRVGAVLSRAEGGLVRYLVRWEDTGEEDEVRSDSRTTFAVRGSLRYQWLVDADSLPGLFASDPKGMVLRLLQEAGVPMTAARVKEELVAFGLDEKKVASAWTAAQKRFASSGVEVQKKGVYVWIGRDAEPMQADDSAAAHKDRAAGRAEITGTAEPPRSGDEMPPDDRPVADARGVERSGTFAEAFARALGDDPVLRIDQYAKRPLQTGTRLGRLSDPVIADLLALLTKEDRPEALTLFLALPGRAEAVDAPERLATLDPATADAVLAAAAAELRRDPAPGPASRVGAGWLLRRVSAATRPPASAALIALMAHIAGNREGDAEALDLAAHALSRNLPLLSSDARDAIDFGKLAAATGNLPLEVEGGRVALLAAVARIRPSGIADEAWWRGATLHALAACAAGRLGSVTSLPPVAERVLRPLVVTEISSVTSRTRLAWILGLPREFADQLPAAAVAAAFRRVASQDPVFAGWAEAFTDDAGVDTLKNELKQAVDAAAAASQQAEAAEQRAWELAERCDRLEELLRREHHQAIAMRASQERQIRIDVVRALADLAAEVEELAANHTAPDLLVERVRSLAAAQALEPIGAAGTDASFDPTQHKPIVGNPVAGAPLRVLRPGYRWRLSDQDILIHKAIVTTS